MERNSFFLNDSDFHQYLFTFEIILVRSYQCSLPRWKLTFFFIINCLYRRYQRIFHLSKNIQSGLNWSQKYFIKKNNMAGWFLLNLWIHLGQMVSFHLTFEYEWGFFKIVSSDQYEGNCNCYKNLNFLYTLPYICKTLVLEIAEYNPKT